MQINLIHGDCLEKMKDIPDKSIDMVLTDPPYKLKSGGRVGDKTPRGGVFALNNEYLKTGNVFKYNEISFKEWVPEVYRVLKDKTHFLAFINNHNMVPFISECLKYFTLKNILVWNKGNKNAHRNYMLQVEFVVLLGKGPCRGINNMGSANLLDFKNQKNKVHLMYLLENSSNNSELVLDPFMGSGSLGVACKNLNRNFIGIEKDETYFNVAKKRIEEC
jgi:site-specific DNA-methyltransferase (adenine-specific)